jgi:hypothetical protein
MFTGTAQAGGWTQNECHSKTCTGNTADWWSTINTWSCKYVCKHLFHCVLCCLESEPRVHFSFKILICAL